MQRKKLVVYVTKLTKKYQTLVKLKKIMTYFFKKNKNKNISKLSKVVKKPNNAEKKINRSF